MAMDLESLKLLVSRMDNQLIQNQVNLHSKLLEKKVLMEEKCKGKVKNINVRAGVADAVGLIDPSTNALPGQTSDSIGSSAAPTQLYALPALHMGQARIPYLSAQTVTKAQDAVDIVVEEMNEVSASLGQYLGRALLNPILSLNSASFTPGDSSTWTATTMTVADRHAFREGQLVDLFAASSSAPTGSRILILKITDVAATSGVAGTVTFSVPDKVEGTQQSLTTAAAKSATAIAAGGAALVLHNSYGSSASSNRALFSLADACGTSTSAMYNQSVSASSWSGNSSGSAAAVTPGRLRDFIDAIKQRGGEKVHAVIMSRLQFADFHESLMSNGSGSGVRFFASGKEDFFGDTQDADLDFYGCKIIADENCPSGQMYVINRDRVKLGVWKEISPFDEKNRVEATETKAEYLLKIAGMHQLLVTKRNGLGIFVASDPS